jgi:DNA protecting protein DprA
VDAREALVALNLIDGIGPVRARQLLEHFADPPAILRASAAQLQRVAGIGPETAAAIASWEKSIDLKGELERIEQFGCHIVIQSDEHYPELLKQIYDPPIVLYVKGELSAKDKNAVAMVGSRMTTHYGMETARKLAFQLAYIGVTVVSGGARGIDTRGASRRASFQRPHHRRAGHGHQPRFPAENKELFERIAAQGAVVTQFPFNRKADKQSFPIRNRLVAGMTLGHGGGRGQPDQRRAHHGPNGGGQWPPGLRRARPHRFPAQQRLPRIDQERRQTVRRRGGHPVRIRVSLPRQQPALDAQRFPQSAVAVACQRTRRRSMI